MKRREGRTGKCDNEKRRCECCMETYLYIEMHKYKGFWICKDCIKDVQEEDNRIKGNIKNYGVTGFKGSQLITFDEEEPDGN